LIKRILTVLTVDDSPWANPEDLNP